jgi:nucleotide-binding universal stress UspA family protein
MIPKKILLATDFSKNAKLGHECARDYAERFGAQLVIVHVIGSWPVHAYKEKLEVDEKAAVQRLREPVNRDLQAMADQFRKTVREVEFHTRVGSPAHEIVQLAEHEKADLIIMGTHGWSGIRYKLLGSVAENVLRLARCSVLVVRNPGGHAKD